MSRYSTYRPARRGKIAGRDIGRKQIRKGWARAYVFEDPFNRVDSYRRAAKKARSADREVWDLCSHF